MDNLTTYEFYKDIYYGDTIEESAFPKWLSRAEDTVIRLTCGNITDVSRSVYDTQIQKAVCAVMDLLYELERATRTANTKDADNIKSRSSGGESVTYAEHETLVGKVLADKTAQNRLLYEAVAEYLSGTGLLYAGV